MNHPIRNENKKKNKKKKKKKKKTPHKGKYCRACLVVPRNTFGVKKFKVRTHSFYKDCVLFRIFHLAIDDSIFVLVFVFANSAS